MGTLRKLLHNPPTIRRIQLDSARAKSIAFAAHTGFIYRHAIGDGYLIDRRDGLIADINLSGATLLRQAFLGGGRDILTVSDAEWDFIHSLLSEGWLVEV